MNEKIVSNKLLTKFFYLQNRGFFVFQLNKFVMLETLQIKLLRTLVN